MAAKNFYGAIDPSIALKVLQAPMKPTLKGGFSGTNEKSSELKQSADGSKKHHAEITVWVILAATTLQFFKKSLERYIAGTTDPIRFL